MWGKTAPFTVMDINNSDGRWSTLGHTTKSNRDARKREKWDTHNGDDKTLSAVRPPLTSVSLLVHIHGRLDSARRTRICVVGQVGRQGGQ